MILKLGMLHRVLQYYQVCSNDALGLTLTYFTARSNLVLCAFAWKKVKTMDFSETLVVYDIKVGRCSQLNEYMRLYEYQRSRSFLDLVPNHSHSIFLTSFPQLPSSALSDTGQIVLWLLPPMTLRTLAIVLFNLHCSTYIQAAL